MIDNDFQLDRISEDPGDQPLGRFVRKLLVWIPEGGEASISVNSIIPWVDVPCLNEKEKPSWTVACIFLVPDWVLMGCPPPPHASATMPSPPQQTVPFLNCDPKQTLSSLVAFDWYFVTVMKKVINRICYHRFCHFFLNRSPQKEIEMSCSS